MPQVTASEGGERMGTRSAFLRSLPTEAYGLFQNTPQLPLTSLRASHRTPSHPTPVRPELTSLWVNDAPHHAAPKRSERQLPLLDNGNKDIRGHFPPFPCLSDIHRQNILGTGLWFCVSVSVYAV